MAVRTSVLFLTLALLAPTAAFAASLGTSTVGDALPGERLHPTAAPSEVRIDRDAYGVPHVYADDTYGIFWGNGYAQAQDRLFQLDVLRHVGKGESARYLGPSQLEMDLATRRELYTAEERTAYFDALGPDDKEMFQAFADGVNGWIAKTRADPTLLSAEFYAIAHQPEDWVPEDTIAVAQYLLAIFGFGSGGNELENAKLLAHLEATLGPEEAEKAFDDFFWMHDASTYTTIPASEATWPATEAPLDFDAISASQWDVIHAAAGAEYVAGGKDLATAALESGMRFMLGSNGVIVAPELSESGNSLLLGGPQMAYHNPMVPYEVGLHGAGFDALGMGVGGAPGMIIGRTPHFSWTVTSGSSDQVDVVALKLVPGNPRQYHGSQGVMDMDCRQELHFGPPTAIDQNPPQLAMQEVCRTEKGPVFAVNEAAGYAFVKEMTHRYDELRSGILWLTLARSQDLASFQAHMETFCFEFNFLQADDGGNIAYNHWGCQPVRDPDCDPRLPRLAGECDWLDVLSGSELPHVANPQQGYLVNWNNKPAQGWSSGDAMEKWGPVHRAQLFEREVQTELQEDGLLSIDDLKEVNERISTREPFAWWHVPILLAATENVTDPQIQEARGHLQEWADCGYCWDDADQDGRYDYPGFAIYERWRLLLQDRVFQDELGAFTRAVEFDPPATSDPHAADHGREDNKENVLVNAVNGLSQHAWFDDVATPQMETHLTVMPDVLLYAISELRAEYDNPDMSAWHQPIHKIKFVALSGGPAWEIPMVNRPSFNHYYDWGTGEAGSVLPPGTDQYWFPADFLRYQADGSMPDPHKRDQLDLYVAFDWKPANMTPATLESSETFVVAP